MEEKLQYLISAITDSLNTKGGEFEKAEADAMTLVEIRKLLIKK